MRMDSDRVRAWWISREAPPGYPKVVVTPSRSRAWTRMSAPLRGRPPNRSPHSGGGAEAREAAAAARAAASSAGVAAAEWVGGLVGAAWREGEGPRWAAVAHGRVGRRLGRGGGESERAERRE